MGGILRDLPVTDLDARRKREPAECLGDRGVVLNTTTDQRNLAPEANREIDQDLHAVET